MENTGVQLIRQASAKTNDVAGDGTTLGNPDISLKFMDNTTIYIRHLEHFIVSRERCQTQTTTKKNPRTATILAHAMVKSGMKQLVGDSMGSSG